MPLHLDAAEMDATVIARSVGIGRQTPQRQLRAKGATLSAQIADVKRQRAQQRLIETDQPFTEIATAVGFANSTCFTRAFKSWAGILPRDYRKQERG